MAKKTSTPGARPRRASSRRASSREDQPATTSNAVSAQAGIAADRMETEPGSAYAPSYEEIAEAAYHRFLQRGGRDGADFDDWIEAERELRKRR